jgi:hypothetical protein
MEYERSLNLYQKCENYAMESLKELLDGTDKEEKKHENADVDKSA